MDGGASWTGNYISVNDPKKDLGHILSANFLYDINNLPVKIIGGVGYTKYTGKSNDVYVSAPVWSSLSHYVGKYETKADLFSISIGAQYELISGFTTPYISLQAVMNKFGSTKLKYDKYYDKITFEGKTRFGLSIGGGLSVNFIPALESDIELIYNMHNLIGREKNENSINSVNVNLSILCGVF